MRSSTTPPVASSQHSVYCACPGAIRARSLVSVALTKSRAPRPRTTPLPRWLTSKIPTACRTAACSLSTPPSGYSIGISQPPKSAILAPRPTWRSYSGEWYSGGPAAAAAAAAAAAGPPLYHSPLYDRHVGLGAKMADFGGWEMPIEYPDGGVLKEHAAVRQAVGIFDVSHLGKGVVRGRGARAPRPCRDG